MDSFPLLKYNPMILQRFVTLCHPDDAMELAKSCKQMNSVVKEFGYKNVSSLAIHGKVKACLSIKTGQKLFNDTKIVSETQATKVLLFIRKAENGILQFFHNDYFLNSYRMIPDSFLKFDEVDHFSL